MKLTTQKGFSVIEILLLVLLTATLSGTGWYVYNQATKNDDTTKNQTTTSVANSKDSDENGLKIVKSGKNGFQVAFPQNWGKIYNVLDGDFMIKVDENQPDKTNEKTLKIQEVPSLGRDGSVVFSIIYDKETVQPNPDASSSPFTIDKGINAVKGTKYVYEYSGDTGPGLGARKKGEKEYMYFFEHGGKNLVVTYNIYASDPRNFVDQVDDIVRSIQLGGANAPADL